MIFFKCVDILQVLFPILISNNVSNVRSFTKIQGVLHFRPGTLNRFRCDGQSLQWRQRSSNVPAQSRSLLLCSSGQNKIWRVYKKTLTLVLYVETIHIFESAHTTSFV